MMENPFILTMPIPAKKAETEVTPIPAEMLIWKNKELCKEALLAFKQDIQFLSQENIHSADSKKLILELPGNILFEYSKYTQSSIDEMIDYLSNEQFDENRVYKLKNKEDIMTKALACLMRHKLHSWATDGVVKDVNMEMALIYAFCC